MTLQTQSTNNQRTRDELSSEPDIQPIYKIKTEKIIVVEGPRKDITNTLGNSWIVGSTTNSIVGTNTGTQGGGQQVVGASGRVETTVNVTNSNKVAYEFFNFTTFRDATTTGDWAVTLGELNLTSGEFALSESVAFNDGTITNATMIVVVKSGSLSDLSLELTADGSTLESVSNGVPYSFSTTGTDLRFKITATGTVTVSQVKINYG